jgi:2-hydroxy-6-oxonona-2,4-dienedioate hydrolase/4,5:9,10-diseco-3-hydroxy-5,9,17-trioxoandrosta-1(10),2-diene-4-oate hydrolase
MTDATTIEWTERTIRVGRRDIFVTEAGTGTPVVLLHGGGAGARARRTTPATSTPWPSASG